MSELENPAIATALENQNTYHRLVGGSELPILLTPAPAPLTEIKSLAEITYSKLKDGISNDALGKSILINLNTVPGVLYGFTFKSHLICNCIFKCLCDTVCHYVSRVQEGSQAAQAGLCVNDIIIKVNKIETYKGATDVLILEQIRMGNIKLQILRPHAGCMVLLAQQYLQMGVLKKNVAKCKIEITKECKLKIKKLKFTILVKSDFGFEISLYKKPVCQSDCFYVRKVRKGSQAANAGLRVNDIIYCIKTYRYNTKITIEPNQIYPCLDRMIKMKVFRPKIIGVVPPLELVPSLPFAANPALLKVAAKQAREAYLGF